MLEFASPILKLVVKSTGYLRHYYYLAKTKIVVVRHKDRNGHHSVPARQWFSIKVNPLQTFTEVSITSITITRFYGYSNDFFNVQKKVQIFENHCRTISASEQRRRRNNVSHFGPFRCQFQLLPFLRRNNNKGQPRQRDPSINQAKTRAFRGDDNDSQREARGVVARRGSFSVVLMVQSPRDMGVSDPYKDQFKCKIAVREPINDTLWRCHRTATLGIASTGRCC